MIDVTSTLGRDRPTVTLPLAGSMETIERAWPMNVLLVIAEDRVWEACAHPFPKDPCSTSPMSPRQAASHP